MRYFSPYLFVFIRQEGKVRVELESAEKLHTGWTRIELLYLGIPCLLFSRYVTKKGLDLFQFFVHF
jgi:hypothetical protein